MFFGMSVTATMQAGHNLYVSVLSSLCLLLLSRNEENRTINSPFSFYIKHGGNRALCQIIWLHFEFVNVFIIINDQSAIAFVAGDSHLGKNLQTY